MTRLISSVAPMQVEFTASGSGRPFGAADFVRSTRKDYFGVSSYPSEKNPKIAKSSYGFYVNGTGSKITRNGNLVMFPRDNGNGPFYSYDGGVTILTPGSPGAGSGGAPGVREMCYLGSNIFIGIDFTFGVYRSTNNGTSFSGISTGVAGLTSPRFVDFCNGYALITQSTASTTAAKSTTGASWSSVTLPIAAGRVRVLNNRMTVWNIGSNQIARATSDDLTTWETVTTPTNIRYVGYGGGKYIYNAESGGNTVIYQSFDFQDWSLLYSTPGSNLLQDILYDKWSQNFIMGTDGTGAYWYGFNKFTRINFAFAVSSVPCSNEDNSIMMVVEVGNAVLPAATLVRDPTFTTITY